VAASSAAKSAEGVIDADDNPSESLLTVIFDDVKTSIEAIREVMKKEGFPVEGAPEYLK